MKFEDFTRHFDEIYICRFFDEPHWKPLYVTSDRSRVALARADKFPFLLGPLSVIAGASKPPQV